METLLEKCESTRPVLQSMPTIQVTSPLSEHDCEPNLWDPDSDSDREVCQDLSNITQDSYSQVNANYSIGEAHTPVERTSSAQSDTVLQQGRGPGKSRSWHGDLKNGAVHDRGRSETPDEDDTTDNVTNPRRPSVIVSTVATTPVSGTDDEMSEEELTEIRLRRKSSSLAVPKKKSRRSRRESGNLDKTEYLFFNHKAADPEVLAAAAKFVTEVLLMAQKEAMQRVDNHTKVDEKPHSGEDQVGKVHRLQKQARKLFLRFLTLCGCFNNFIPSP